MATQDICRVCLEKRDLSFDHVPPKAAFNKDPVWWSDPVKALHLTKEERLQHRGRKQQRGSGRNSLCQECNTMLGTRYVRAYADLAKDVFNLLYHRAMNETVTLGPFAVRTMPLRVIKCVCGMALSISEPARDMQLDAMRDFVQQKDSRRLPAGMRVFLYASRSKTVRQYSSFAALTLHSGPVSFTELYSEPIGAILTFDSGPLDTRHTEITHFARHGYDEQVEMFCTLPILAVDSVLPQY